MKVILERAKTARELADKAKKESVWMNCTIDCDSDDEMSWVNFQEYETEMPDKERDFSNSDEIEFIEYEHYKPLETLVPELCNDIILLTQIIEKQRQALEFYASNKSWTSYSYDRRQYVCVDKIDCDYIPNHELMIQRGGVTARQALKSVDDLLNEGGK